MKKVILKYFPQDRIKVLKSINIIRDRIASISMTEGIFAFMRGTAIIEMYEKDFNTNFTWLKSRLKSVCSKDVKVILL